MLSLYFTVTTTWMTQIMTSSQICLIDVVSLLYSYYHLDDTDHDVINQYLSMLVERALSELQMSYCIELAEVRPTLVNSGFLHN